MHHPLCAHYGPSLVRTLCTIPCVHIVHHPSCARYAPSLVHTLCTILFSHYAQSFTAHYSLSIMRTLCGFSPSNGADSPRRLAVAVSPIPPGSGGQFSDESVLSGDMTVDSVRVHVRYIGHRRRISDIRSYTEHESKNSSQIVVSGWLTLTLTITLTVTLILTLIMTITLALHLAQHQQIVYF